MSTISPIITSTGGSIHLNYAPGSNTGISNRVALVLSLRILPSYTEPKAILTLELLPGHFLFDNNSLIMVKDLGKVADGEVIIKEFVIICSVPDPAEDLAMKVSTRDKGEDLSESTLVTFTVKKETTTQEHVKRIFLSN